MAGATPGLGLEETIASGGYNDTPAINYDFQAPLGADGDERSVLRQLRPHHLFLRYFGDQLAPMAPRLPAVLPSSPADLATPRWALRSRGDAGFVFVSNHIRQHATEPWRAVRFELQLPSGPLTFPSQPIDVPTGAHFIWPVNLPLQDARLVYATAQPVARAVVEGVETWVLAAEPGIAVELQLAGVRKVRAQGAQVSEGLVTGLTPGLAAEVDLETAAGRHLRLLVLTRAQAEGLLVTPRAGGDVLITSPDAVWLQAGRLQLRRRGEPELRFASWPALQRGGQVEGRFSHQRVAVAPMKVPAVQAQPLRSARALPPPALTGPRQSVVAPAPELYGRSAAWRLSGLPGLPTRWPAGVSELWLQLDVAGDVARLYRGLDLVDDHFDAGPPWEIALGRLAAKELTLTVLPLRPDTPIYFAQGQRPRAADGGPVAELRGVRLVPEYAAELPLR